MQSFIAKGSLEQSEGSVCSITESNSSRLAPKPQTGRLRVGALVTTGKIPSWMLGVLRQIEEPGSFELVVIKVASGQRRRTSKNWRYFVFDLWKKFDFASFAAENNAFTLVDMPRELNQVNTLHVASRVLNNIDREQLKSMQLDLILSLDQDELIPQFLDVAKGGVWSFSGDGESGRASAFWDIYERRHTSTATIVRHTRAGSDVIYRAAMACDPRSLARQRNQVCSRWPTFVQQALLQWSAGTSTQIQDHPTADPEIPMRSQLPGNLQMLNFLGRQFRDGLLRQIRRSLFQEQWFMGIRKRRAGSGAFRLGAFNIIGAPPGHFYADPFVYENGNGQYLFFEDYVRAQSKGVIACVEIDDSGSIGDPRTVLETECHLSYPTIFQWDGQTYMLPETRDSGRISLFRAVEFPWRWEFDKVLINSVWAVDPTLLEHGGKFWMFAAGVERRGLIDGELFLFFSDSPLGPWLAHPRNPVVADARRARPAGQVFLHEGQLIRPGQDCARQYGRAVVLNRIEVLSETEYRESPFLIMEPDWFPGNIGTHTWNQSAHYQVVDGRLYSPKYDISSSWRSIWNRSAPSSSCFQLPRRA